MEGAALTPKIGPVVYAKGPEDRPGQGRKISFDVAGHLAGNWFVEGEVPLGSGKAAAEGFPTGSTPNAFTPAALIYER